MRTMIALSMLLNIAVLTPVCAGLLLRLDWVDQAYGTFTAARGILLSIYLAILLCSIAMFFKPYAAAVATLIAAQIIYKVTTPFTVGAIDNPVVISNLAIAAFHVITLSLILREGKT